MEQLCLQENLSVCDGNNVSGNICGNVSCLCLDDRKCSQGTAAVCLIQSCGTLQKSGMEIENISRICLTSRWTTDQQGKCTISNRMLTLNHRNDKYIFSLYIKYSPIAHPEYGAMYCSGLASEAVAATTMVIIHSAISCKSLNQEDTWNASDQLQHRYRSRPSPSD